ncbi:MAG: RnfABCDGE type electron transport complex subunit G [Muribaculaceae bacterium]|nr:RnfABCDGE type electron transport complex subunit G [Muribaculaceae bacterium]
MKGNSVIRMIVSLGVITILAGALLGYVNSLTADTISNARQQAKVDALAKILPSFDNNPISSARQVAVDGDSMTVYPAAMGSSAVGCAVECTATDGFSGNISLMFGFDTSGVVTGFEVLSHSETPGLGAKMADWFATPGTRHDVIGADPAVSDMRVNKDGGDIDGITAATITSRAFLGALNRAHAAAIIYNKE